MAVTLDQITDAYANLLIAQFQNKPKARATIKAALEPFFINQCYDAIEGGYDVSSAIGVQLDVLAKWVGIFSPYPGQRGRVQRTFNGQYVLSDTELMQLIKIKIIQNEGSQGGVTSNSVAAIQALISTFFSGQIQVFNHQNMTMGYYFDTTFGASELLEVMIKGGYLPVPMGVQLNSLIYATEVLTTGFFGFKRYGETPPLSVGLKNYGQDCTGRFLTYMEAIAI